MSEYTSEKTQLMSNIKCLLKTPQNKEMSYLKRTSHISKGVYLSSSNNAKLGIDNDYFNENIYDEKLNMEDFSIIEELGYGAFGIVYKAFNDKWDEYLALKIISLPKNIESDQKQSLIRHVISERFLLQQVNLLKNRHFIKFYSIFKDNSDPFEEKMVFAMENGAGNMSDILFYRKTYSQKEIAYIIHYLAKALHHCEKNYIANRDIKPENLIIVKDENNEFFYKIADFGIGCHLSSQETFLFLSDCPGYTELYAAPELMEINYQGNKKYSPFKADVFSLGITILKMMGLSSNEIRYLKKNFNINCLNENLKKGYEKILGVIKKMLDLNPKTRPSFSEVYKLFDNIPKIKPFERDYFKKLEEKIDNLSLDQKMNKCEKMFYLYERINDMEKALHYGDLCLKLTEKIKGSYSYATAYWNFLIGNIFQEKRNYDFAVKFYKKSYEILFEIDEKITGLTANILNNIALIYREQGKYGLAFKILQKSLRINKYLYEENDSEYAYTLNNLASIYQLFDKRTALNLYEKAYIISLKNQNQLYNNAACVYLNNLAEIHRKIGNFKDSLHLNKKCIHLKQNICNSSDFSLSITFNNIALAYYEKNKYEKSLSFLQKAIEIKEKNLIENHFSFGNSFFNLGCLYEKLNEREKAKDFLQKSAFILKENFGKKYPCVQEASNKLVRLSEIDKNLKQNFREKY